MTASTSLLRDQKIFFDQYDLTTQSNSVNLAYSAAQLDNTTLGNDTKINTPGLKDATVSIAGFDDAGALDAGLFAEIAATAGKPLSVCATSAPGALAYLINANAAKYGQDGKVGGLLSFTLDAVAAGKLIRGTLLENQAAVIATGAGTARQLVSASAGQSLYAALHVFGVAGTSTPTLTLTLKSNSTNSFSGGETSRIAFAAVTAPGSQMLSLAGALTDTWYEAEWTVSGTNPSFQFALVVGIQ